MEFTYIGNQNKKDVRLTGSFANGAFVTANSAASFANAAFDRANAAFLQANTSGGGGSSTPVTIYSDVFTANGNTSTFNLSTSPEDENYIIAVVDGITQLRSTYTVTGNVVTFDSAFDNGANVEITTITGGGESPYAANHANLAYAQANAAFTQANNSTDTWVRTQANSAFDKANSAGSFANSSFVTANASYDQANTGALFANGAFITANSGASFANGAFDRANAAYAAANTGSGVGGVLTSFVDTFTANGISNNFTLSTTPTNKNITFVSIQGVLQPKESYNISGTILTFDSTPPNTAFIEITTLNGASDNAAFIAANAAFITANSGASFANAAFIQANAAFTQANTASIRYITLNETGNIVIKTGTVRFYPPSNIAINNVYASLSTTSANTFTFEVVKNGSVVGTYNIDSNTNKMTVAAANINLTSNDYLTVNITNGSQASDLRIDLEYK